MNDMDQRFVAVFDREGVLLWKLRMLYGFYYPTSCPAWSALLGLARAGRSFRQK